MAKEAKAALLSQIGITRFTAPANSTRWVRRFNMDGLDYQHASNFTTSNPTYVINANSYSIDHATRSTLSIASFIQKWGRCYEFLRKCDKFYNSSAVYPNLSSSQKTNADSLKFTSTQKANIRTFLLDWSQYFRAQADHNIWNNGQRQILLDNTSVNLTHVQNLISGASTNRTDDWRYRAYKNGTLSARQLLQNIHVWNNNRRYLGACTAAENFIRFKQPEYTISFKRLHASWMLYGCLIGTEPMEMGEKGDTSNPQQGLSYSMGMSSMIGNMMRCFARIGDNWMRNFTVTGGLGLSNGAKSLENYMSSMMRYVDQSHSDGLRIHPDFDSYSSTYVIDMINNGNSRDSAHDAHFSIMNYFYKSSLVKDTYNRVRAGTVSVNNYTMPGHPSSPEVGGTGRSSSCFFQMEMNVLFYINKENTALGY